MEKAINLTGLYVITPTIAIGQNAENYSVTNDVALALRGGAHIVQYRDKSRDDARRLRQARELMALCRQYQAIFIVNDDVELAAAVGAHGVHLGGEDTPLKEARGQLGDEAIIGISCYNRLDLALEAERLGADYVAFGRFFPSRTKPDAVQADLDLLREARSRLHIPLVAIGGITAQNGAQLIAAGAHMLAVADAVFAQSDIEAAARQLSSLWAAADRMV